MPVNPDLHPDAPVRGDGLPHRPHAKPYGGMRADRDGFAAMLRPDPLENVIVGGTAIKRYLGVKSYTTLWRWIELYGLPVVKRPDGLWMTTMTAVDQWIFLAVETANENLKRSRGVNAKAEIALRRLQQQVADGSFDEKIRNTALKVAKNTGAAPNVSAQRLRNWRNQDKRSAVLTNKTESGYE